MTASADIVRVEYVESVYPAAFITGNAGVALLAEKFVRFSVVHFVLLRERNAIAYYLVPYFSRSVCVLAFVFSYRNVHSITLFAFIRTIILLRQAIVNNTVTHFSANVQFAQIIVIYFYTRISFFTKNPLYFFQNPYIMYLSEFLMKGYKG